MIQIMHWVVRAQRKKVLCLAESISISVDDRADFRVMRYRCSFRSMEDFCQAAEAQAASAVPASPAVPAASLCKSSSLEEWAAMEPLTAEGLLGVLRLGRDVSQNNIEQHDIDKSEKMADTVLEILQDVCSDTEGHVDKEALERICGRIQHFASDQGASVLKCGQVLTQRPQLSNLLWLSADAAHQVRIATKDPLSAQEGFKRQWDRLFSERHALVPDIQNSEVWRSRLIAAQKVVLRSCQTQGADVNKVLQTFSFAKQRFDSVATPMLKYCCMLRAIALVCALQAADATGHNRLKLVMSFSCFNFLI